MESKNELGGGEDRLIGGGEQGNREGVEGKVKRDILKLKFARKDSSYFRGFFFVIKSFYRVMMVGY